jgi:hypothetical protein
MEMLSTYTRFIYSAYVFNWYVLLEAFKMLKFKYRHNICSNYVLSFGLSLGILYYQVGCNIGWITCIKSAQVNPGETDLVSS